MYVNYCLNTQSNWTQVFVAIWQLWAGDETPCLYFIRKSVSGFMGLDFVRFGIKLARTIIRLCLLFTVVLTTVRYWTLSWASWITPRLQTLFPNLAFNITRSDSNSNSLCESKTAHGLQHRAVKACGSSHYKSMWLVTLTLGLFIYAAVIPVFHE